MSAVFAKEALISLSDFCDVGCKFCFRADRGSDTMTQAKLARILSRLKELGVTEVCYTGGEPTDHPELVMFCKIALQFGIYPSVVTAARNDLQMERLKSALRFLVHVTVSAETSSVIKKYKSTRTIEGAAQTLAALNIPSKSLHIIADDLNDEDLADIKSAIVATNALLEISPMLPANPKFRKNIGVIRNKLNDDIAKLSSIAQLSDALKLLAGQNDNNACESAECAKRRLYVSASGKARFCPYMSEGGVSLDQSREIISAELAQLAGKPHDKLPECMVVCK